MAAAGADPPADIADTQRPSVPMSQVKGSSQHTDYQQLLNKGGVQCIRSNTKKPEVVDLTGVDAFGECADGSGDVDDCDNGNVAVISCGDGNNAVTSCADGNGV
jgi:hypothetical protein